MTRLGEAIGIVAGLVVTGLVVACDDRQHVESRAYPAAIYERDAEPALGQQPPNLGGPWDTSTTHIADPGSSYKTIALGNDIDGMNDGQLVQYLNSLTYDRSVENGQLALFPCKRLVANAEQPCMDRDYVSAFIEPEVGMKNMAYNDIQALPFGLVVARIIVYERGGMQMMPKFRVAVHRHAWWLVRKVNGNLVSQIISHEHDQANNRPFRILNVDPLEFMNCASGDPWPADSPTTARWWTCKTSTYYHTTMMRKTAKMPGVSRFQLAVFSPFIAALSPPPQEDVALDAAGWIRCGNGCCATAAQ